MDKRKFNKGTKGNKGGGRPAKEDEDRIRGLCISALEKVYGSEEEAFKYIADLSKDSYPHLKLLFEYGYGKPKERLDVKHIEVLPIFDLDE